MTAGTVGRTLLSVEHRCPRMRAHVDPQWPLAAPCGSCYSVVVTAVTVPFTPVVQPHEVLPGG